MHLGDALCTRLERVIAAGLKLSMYGGKGFVMALVSGPRTGKMF